MIKICMPMDGKKWRTKYDKVEDDLKKMGHEVVPLYLVDFLKEEPQFKYQVINNQLLRIGDEFYRLSICDTALFCMGWETDMVCQIEHRLAKRYKLKIMYEESTYV